MPKALTLTLTTKWCSINSRCSRRISTLKCLSKCNLKTTLLWTLARCRCLDNCQCKGSPISN